MIAQDTARNACEAVWLAMVELAETANDEVISKQRDAHPDAAGKVAAAAYDLATLAKAAAVLAEYMARTP